MKLPIFLYADDYAEYEQERGFGITEEKWKDVMGIHVKIEELKCLNLVLANDGKRTLEAQEEEISQI